MITACNGSSHQQTGEKELTDEAPSVTQEQEDDTVTTDQLSYEDYKHKVKKEAAETLQQLNTALEEINDKFGEKMDQKQGLREKVEKMNIFKHKLNDKIEQLDSSRTKEAINQLDQDIQRLKEQIHEVMEKDSLINGQ